MKNYKYAYGVAYVPRCDATRRLSSSLCSGSRSSKWSSPSGPSSSAARSRVAAAASHVTWYVTHRMQNVANFWFFNYSYLLFAWLSSCNMLQTKSIGNCNLRHVTVATLVRSTITRHKCHGVEYIIVICRYRVNDGIATTSRKKRVGSQFEKRLESAGVCRSHGLVVNGSLFVFC